jgi:hypothetical protein
MMVIATSAQARVFLLFFLKRAITRIIFGIESNSTSFVGTQTQVQVFCCLFTCHRKK